MANSWLTDRAKFAGTGRDTSPMGIVGKSLDLVHLVAKFGREVNHFFVRLNVKTTIFRSQEKK